MSARTTLTTAAHPHTSRRGVSRARTRTCAPRVQVDVVVLRRCKAQLDVAFLRKVLQRRVDQGLVDSVVASLDKALAEHADAAEIERLRAGAAAKGLTASALKHLEIRARVDELTGVLVSKEELARLIEMERSRVKDARVTKEELIGVRLYTGPAFMKFNTVRVCGGVFRLKVEGGGWVLCCCRVQVGSIGGLISSPMRSD